MPDIQLNGVLIGTIEGLDYINGVPLNSNVKVNFIGTPGVLSNTGVLTISGGTGVSGISLLFNGTVLGQASTLNFSGVGGTATINGTDGTVQLNKMPSITCNNKIVHMGHSIVAYCVDAALPGSNTHSSYVARINMFLLAAGLPGLELTYNIGVPSVTIESVIANQLPAALTTYADADIAWLQIGINNLNASLANNDSLSTIYTQMNSLVTSLATGKKFVIIDAILPINQAGNSGARPRAWQIKQINEVYQRICNQFNNVYYNDIYSKLIDTSSSALNPLPNSTWSTDGIHLTALGAYYISQGVANELFANFNLNLTQTYDPSGKTNYAPTLGLPRGTGSLPATDGGGITGTAFIPPNVTVAVVTGSAAVAVSQNPPNMTRFTITNGGGTASVVRLLITDTSGLAANFSVGQKLIGGVNIQLSGCTLLSRVDMYMQRDNLTTSGNIIHDFETNGAQTGTVDGTNYPQTSRTEYHRTNPLAILLTNPTNLQLAISIQVDASTGAATVDFSDFFLYAF